MKAKKPTSRDYFNRAKSWADDNFSALQQSRNRYQLAFLIGLSLNMVSVITIAILADYQTLVPLIVHHYDNGITTIEPSTSTNAPINKTQIESDIVRYINHREAYDISSYRMQFDLINLLSNDTVGNEYSLEQDKSQKNAPINLLKTDASREVHVYSVNFLDTSALNQEDLVKNHHNLAEIVFTLTDKHKSGQILQTEHYSALISWDYTAPPTSPALRWQNWDGFQVVRYSKTLRNV